jgi:hypothetical protein
VVGTRLGIDDDDHDRPRFAFRMSPDVARNWAIYDLATDLQHAALFALSSALPDAGDPIVDVTDDDGGLGDVLDDPGPG